MYILVKNLVGFPKNVYLNRRETSTRGHNVRFLQPHTSVLKYKHSFFLSMIRIWNKLPEGLTQKPSLESFKVEVAKLDIAV